MDELPNLLKTEGMKSLTQADGTNASSSGMNLQQRVIQSGLDSLSGDEAESIVTLFKSMAVFAEDQVVPMAIIGVLWTSLSIAKGKLSVITLRQWLSQLLSRSILLGSVGDGVSMHDVSANEIVN